MDRIGLCSVTLRALAAGEVAELAAAAGLRVIEWGGDVHAPPGGALEEVREQTATAGLRTCSYGSYWRADGDFTEVARAAVVLGAPRIRVWAGTEGSADASARTRSRVVGALREATEIAVENGLSVALEFHSRTLADTPAAALRLLDEVGMEALSTYWQPPAGEPAGSAVEGLRAIADRVSAVHVFSWWPDENRIPLADRARLWLSALEVVAGRPVDLLLEFVPDDDPGALAREAKTLLRWVKEVG